MSMGKSFTDKQLYDAYKAADPKATDPEILTRIALFRNPSSAMNASKLDLSAIRDRQQSLLKEKEALPSKARADEIEKELREIDAQLKAGITGGPQYNPNAVREVKNEGKK